MESVAGDHQTFASRSGDAILLHDERKARDIAGVCGNGVGEVVVEDEDKVRPVGRYAARSDVAEIASRGGLGGGEVEEVEARGGAGGVDDSAIDRGETRTGVGTKP